MEIWYVMDKRSGNASDEDDNSIYDVLTQAKNKKSKRIITKNRFDFLVE